jgi:hypothetical protein
LAGNVQNQICRAPIGDARLADRAGIDEVVGIVVESDLVARPSAHHTISQFENPKVMRVSERANARSRRMRGKRVEAQPSPIVVIEPDEFTTGVGMQRAVHGYKVILDAELQRQAGQELESVGTEPSARPGNRPCCNVAEPIGRDLTTGGALVAAGDTKRVDLPEQRNAFGGVCVVANDVAETYHPIYRPL